MSPCPIKPIFVSALLKFCKFMAYLLQQSSNRIISSPARIIYVFMVGDCSPLKNKNEVFHSELCQGAQQKSGSMDRHHSAPGWTAEMNLCRKRREKSHRATAARSSGISLETALTGALRQELSSTRNVWVVLQPPLTP